MQDHDTIAEDLQDVRANAAAYIAELLKRTGPASDLAELNELYRLRMLEKFATFGLEPDLTDLDRRQALTMCDLIFENWRRVGFSDLFCKVAATLNLDIIEPTSAAVH